MWDHDSAETEHFGRCPHTVDMALIDSAGAVRAKTSVWFGIADMTFAVSSYIPSRVCAPQQALHRLTFRTCLSPA